jgi:hypothetical protein
VAERPVALPLYTSRERQCRSGPCFKAATKSYEILKTPAPRTLWPFLSFGGQIRGSRKSIQEAQDLMAMVDQLLARDPF